MGTLTGRPAVGFGPWCDDLPADERKARVRELRALAHLLAPDFGHLCRAPLPCSKEALTMARQKAPDTPADPPAETPQPTDAERAEVRDYIARVKARGRRPLRFMVERRPGKPGRLNQTHVHPDIAGFRMMNTLGTTSIDLADRLVSQILNATHLQPSGEPISENTLNAALGAVAGIAPQDEAEAMLAAQMVGVHWVAMDLLRQAGTTDSRFQFNDAGNMAVKLLRTYTAQLEALKRYRSAGEQRVVVQHQHVNVTADRAAVQVNGGANSASGGRGATSKPEERSHAQADTACLAHAPESSMPCPDATRNAVPAAGGDGEGAVPDARRR
jgi:hypothetical protein